MRRPAHKGTSLRIDVDAHDGGPLSLDRYDRVLLVLLGIYAYGLTFHAGSRGLMPLDQAINFDGGWRIVSGQVPYRDFLLPNGPVSILLQAISFKLAGVNYYAHILPAAVLDVLASLGVFVAVRMVYPRARWASVAAGALTATYFYPQVGTTYMENTGFFFGLVALLSALYAVRARVPRRLRPLLLTLAGASVSLAVLSKINVGLVVAPLVPLLVLSAHGAERRRALRDCVPIAAGMAFCAAIFAGWLWAASDPAAFWEHVIEIPAGLGRQRLQESGPERVVKCLLWGRSALPPPLLIQVAHLAIVTSTVSFWARNRKAVAPQSTRARLVVLLGAGAILAQNAFNAVTLNRSVNAQPFLGLAVGLTLAAGALPLAFPGPAARTLGRYRALQALAAVACLGLLLVGFRAAHTREMHEGIFDGGRFSPIQDASLTPLRWSEPTMVQGEPIRERDLLRLLAHLRGPSGAAPEPFFVFPEFSLLYGLVGVPSPQPLLWFDRGLTYPREYDAALDREIVASLERNAVKRVVIERVSFGSTQARLGDFPLLRRWIAREFLPEATFGIFVVLRRSPAYAPARVSAVSN